GPLRAHLSFVEQALDDGRRFLFGEQPSVADLAVYHSVWFVRDRAQAKDLADFRCLNAWADRMAAFGHGTPRDADAQEALAAARAAEPEPGDAVVAPNPLGLVPGLPVRAAPDDTGREPTFGTLVAIDAQRVTLRREAPEVGRVHVHFPRAGFIVVPAK